MLYKGFQIGWTFMFLQGLGQYAGIWWVMNTNDIVLASGKVNFSDTCSYEESRWMVAGAKWEARKVINDMVKRGVY